MDETDRERCLRLLTALSPDPEQLQWLVVDGEPRSKARPRFSGSGHAYNSVKQREAERALAWHLKLGYKTPFDGNLAVVCIFYRSTHGRIDVDNLLKQVLDAANGICWNDDMQVTALLGVVELDKKHPRTVLAIAPHMSTLSRATLPLTTCRRCGKSVQPVRGHANRRFCSTACASRSVGHDLSELIACRCCGKMFKRRGWKQQFCGTACRVTMLHARRRDAGRVKRELARALKESGG